MFNCKCGKRHQKTSEIGRSHWKRYMEATANAIAKDKPDPKVHDEVMAEIRNSDTTKTNTSMIENVVGELSEDRIRKYSSVTPDAAPDVVMLNHVMPDNWTEGKEVFTTYRLDRFLLGHLTKNDINMIIEKVVVIKNDTFKANWRIPSWEDMTSHALMPFSLDEEEKYAIIVDTRQGKKTGIVRKARMLKALKEATKPYDIKT